MSIHTQAQHQVTPEDINLSQLYYSDKFSIDEDEFAGKINNNCIF
jgi:hypothetical protein